MAEASGKGDSHQITAEIERIIKKNAGEDLPPLNSLAKKDAEQAVGRKDEEFTAEKFKELYVRLNNSLEILRIRKHPSSLKKRKRPKGVDVEGLGVVRVEEFTEADKQSEGLMLRVEIVYNQEDEKNNILQEIIELGSEGKKGYYERNYKKKPGEWGYLPEDAIFVFLNIEKVALALENAAEKRKNR